VIPCQTPIRACLLLVSAAICLLIATRAQAASAGTKFGIYYAVWHCPAATGNPDGRPIYDIAKILSGQGSWGPVPDFHWWSKPAAGYYCLAKNDALLKQHAMLLRDAGIDFIYVDSTNWQYVDNRDNLDSASAVITPFNELLKVWNGIPGAPKVVPWAPLTTFGNLLEYLLRRLESYPNLKFYYQGKPLALVVNNDSFPVNPTKFQQLSATYTVRKMWAFVPPDPPGTWSYMEACVPGFKASNGTKTCKQNYAVRDGTVEEVPIIGAYQDTYISKAATATPRFHGRTFAKQFETLSNHPSAPIALIYGWNEWMAQRFCFNAAGDEASDSKQCSTDQFPDHSKVFVDEYSEEYSKDIEPMAGPPGDYYYRLMKACIELYHKGGTCDETSVPAAEQRRPR
jgi:hypothetical protein